MELLLYSLGGIALGIAVTLSANFLERKLRRLWRWFDLSQGE
jgi:hypothetical protein